MKLQTIQEHTFDLDLLDKNYPALDVGCRFFDLVKPFKDLGIELICMDPDPLIRSPDYSVIFLNAALTKSDGFMNFSLFGNGTGNYIISDLQPNGGHKVVKVKTMTISSLMKYCIVEKFSAVKLDCEGCEYDILMNWPGPIANQISVEFHEHTIIKPHTDEYFQTLITHLSQWYNPPINLIKEKRHCLATPNYWDVLFTIKG